ncbi:hydroxymethylbilane synthase [Cellulomonas sp. ATA003]|uniref:hydroxymethylbilane synthase n=1 Tax=Cellulomonas sp. ATA003 TaxID=3073064 RepID=UPI002872FE58|nr:hydroxymethylbilane synthase [Cellulomonas sp. ATA003]WNB85683.1 hydroxymethylbilane synthase [Cellulomonas sp. ATA003]
MPPSPSTEDAAATVRVGTRASALALTQTGTVADLLAAAGPLRTELVRITTDGDRLTGSLVALGGTGVFVTALREALLDGRCDVAVHSLKDLPSAGADGLVLGAVPVREDPRDALCARDGLTLATLPAGARVGTGSPRRAAQLRAARPDLVILDIRGNVDTRLRRVAPGDLDAVVLARAGLARLGRLDAVTELIDVLTMSPAPGQGALAVEVRSEAATDPGHPLARALAAVDHAPSRLAVTAERALLARLEAGCAAPIGAHARLTGTTLALDAVVCRVDGSERLRRSQIVEVGALAVASGDGHAVVDGAQLAAAVGLGTEVAEVLLADGAGDLAELGALQ